MQAIFGKEGEQITAKKRGEIHGKKNGSQTDFRETLISSLGEIRSGLARAGRPSN